MSEAQVYQLIAVIYLLVGVGIIFNKKHFTKLLKSLPESKIITLYGGIMAIIIGFLLLAFHDKWTSDFSFFLTLFGWLALLKGALIMVFPKIFDKILLAISKKKEYVKYFGIIAFLIGVLFTYLGFFSV